MRLSSEQSKIQAAQRRKKVRTKNKTHPLVLNEINLQSAIGRASSRTYSVLATVWYNLTRDGHCCKTSSADYLNNC